MHLISVSKDYKSKKGVHIIEGKWSECLVFTLLKVKLAAKRVRLIFFSADITSFP